MVGISPSEDQNNPCFSLGIDVLCYTNTGLVDYVSDPGSTGFDRALQLAQDISRNGEHSITLPFWLGGPESCHSTVSPPCC